MRLLAVPSFDDLRLDSEGPTFRPLQSLGQSLFLTIAASSVLSGISFQFAEEAVFLPASFRVFSRRSSSPIRSDPAANQTPL